MTSPRPDTPAAHDALNAKLRAPAAPKRMWQRTPPAIFPPMMGLFGLGLAWRRGHDAFGIGAGVVEMLLGAVTLLYLFGLLAYVAKLLRRPAVVAEDLRILPGRAGLGAMVLSLYLLASVLVPYGVGVATALLLVGFAAHGALLFVLVRVLLSGPAEQRQPTPVWHLNFVGFILGALAAADLGMTTLATVLLALMAVLAVAIWGLSVVQLITRIPPAPLRPLLAIHLAPAAVLGLVAAELDRSAVAGALAIVAALILAGLVIGLRWVTSSGFSPLWGAFTFPVAATASLWFAVGGIWQLPGALCLVVATLITPPIAWRVMQLWAKGKLAIATNAATA